MQAFFVGIFVEVSQIKAHFKRISFTFFLFYLLSICVFLNDCNIAKENNLLVSLLCIIILCLHVRHTHTVMAFSFPRES